MLPEELKSLRDIHLPPEPSWWPPGAAWWLILGSLILVGIAILIIWIRRERRYWYIQSLILLRKIDSQPAEHQIIHVQWLLKRVANTLYPHENTAQLTGKAWLEFLDKTGKTNAFTLGPGQALAYGPYQSQCAINWNGLRPHIEQWLAQQKKKFSSSSLPKNNFTGINNHA